ncbi:MAG: hypothetical protein IH991_07460 [Planctomycetes bacterium]|nr:hypothetical protein [Planctomycetota bacterium]
MRDLIGVDYFADVVFVNCAYSEKVEDLEPLRELTQLLAVDLRDTKISDLTPLRELTQLQELYLGGTRVSDLSPLVGIKGVTLYLREGQEVTIP